MSDTGAFYKHRYTGKHVFYERLICGSKLRKCILTKNDKNKHGKYAQNR